MILMRLNDRSRSILFITNPVWSMSRNSIFWLNRMRLTSNCIFLNIFPFIWTGRDKSKIQSHSCLLSYRFLVLSSSGEYSKIMTISRERCIKQDVNGNIYSSSGHHWRGKKPFWPADDVEIQCHDTYHSRIQHNDTKQITLSTMQIYTKQTKGMVNS